MNRLRPYLTALLLGACVWLPALPAVADEEMGLITSYPFRDSFARHHPVKGSPRIEIKGGISGPVIITSGRTGMVDIDVLRTAATQQELDCHEVKIDYGPVGSRSGTFSSTAGGAGPFARVSRSRFACLPMRCSTSRRSPGNCR